MFLKHILSKTLVMIQTLSKAYKNISYYVFAQKYILFEHLF